MSVKEAMEAKLQAALSPKSLEVIDDSHRHVGHAGHKPGGETHFTIILVAEIFAGKSRVERHRLVNQVLADELAGPVHALALSTKAPGEA